MPRPRKAALQLVKWWHASVPADRKDVIARGADNGQDTRRAEKGRGTPGQKAGPQRKLVGAGLAAGVRAGVQPAPPSPRWRKSSCCARQTA